jgi:hypothetical protein
MNNHQRIPSDTEHDKYGHIDVTKTAFVDGHIEEFVDFPYDEIDRGNPLVAEISGASDAARAEAAIVIEKLLLWIWSEPEVRPAMVRLAAATAAIRPALLAGKSYKSIGEELHLTKQSISKAARLFQAAFGFKPSRSRPDSACKNMAIAARGNTSRRKWQVKQDGQPHCAYDGL